MGKESKIEWTTHTFNPWRGCTKVSPGCQHCYAESLAKRNPDVLGIWGPNGTRVVAVDSYWDQARKWDRAAKAAGERHRVFCASLADVFEDWQGPIVDASGNRLFSYVDVNASAIDGSVGATLDNARAKLFRLIRQTPNLDWLLLTKRPQNIVSKVRRVASMWEFGSEDRDFLGNWVDRNEPPANVWLGTSVENQATANERIPHLLSVPATVRFLSMEPLLGPVDFGCLFPNGPYCTNCGGHEHLCKGRLEGINWVIVGGESGHGARPMHPDWVRSIRDQCVAAGVPFFFKQFGEWRPDGQGIPFLKDAIGSRDSHEAMRIDADGRDMTQMDGLQDESDVIVRRLGKKKAGRLLDGRTWDELPIFANTEAQ